MPRSMQSTAGSSTAHLSPPSSTSSRTMAPRRQLESVTSVYSDEDADGESDGGHKRRPTPPLISFDHVPAPTSSAEKLRALLTQMETEARSSTPLGIRRGTDSLASSSSRKSDESPPRPGRGVWRDGRSRRGFPPPSPTRRAAQVDAARSHAKLVDVESVETVPEVEEESPPTPPPRIHHYLSASASRRAADDHRTPTPPQPHPRALAVHAGRAPSVSPKRSPRKPSPLESFIASKPVLSPTVRRRPVRTVEPAPESSELFARGIDGHIEVDVDESAIAPPWDLASSSDEVDWSPPRPEPVDEAPPSRRPLFRSGPVSTPVRLPPKQTAATPHPPGGWEFTPAGRRVRFSPPAETEVIHRVKYSPLKRESPLAPADTSFVKRLFDSPRKAIQSVAPNRRRITIPPPSTTHRDFQPRLSRASDEVQAAQVRVERATSLWLDAVRARELALNAVKTGWTWGTWAWWLAMELLLIWGVFRYVSPSAWITSADLVSRLTVDYATSHSSSSGSILRSTPPIPPAFLIRHQHALNIFDLIDSLDFAQRWNDWGWGNEPLGLPL